LHLRFAVCILALEALLPESRGVESSRFQRIDQIQRIEQISRNTSAFLIIMQGLFGICAM